MYPSGKHSTKKGSRSTMAKEKDRSIVTDETTVPADRLADFPARSADLVIWTDMLKQDGKDVPFWYVGPRDAAAHQRLTAALTGEALDGSFDLMMYALDLKGRAA